MEHVIIPDVGTEGLADAPDYSLFSAGQIAVATFFGSVLTGGLMLARNYSKLGDGESARRAVALSTLAFVLLWAVGAVVFSVTPESAASPVSTWVNIIIALGLRHLAGRWQGEQFAEHVRRGGKRASGWVVAAIIVLAFAASVSLLVTLMSYANG